jgi:uncharacterized OB-fold protein
VTQTYAANGRPLPLITPLAQPFFDAARRQELVMQRCPRDGFFFYPRARCPQCLGDDWAWQPARRTGTVRSFTVDRTGQDPNQRGRIPFVIALVDLDEGPRMIANATAPVEVGQHVSLEFELLDGQPIVVISASTASANSSLKL